MNEIITTKYGNAKTDIGGYYRITTRKEGNHGKMLHRLIWEDHYGKPVPDGYDIHHINLDKRDNRIQNLQCVEHNLHMRFHSRNISEETRKKISEKNKGRPCSKETRKRISKARNTSGIMNVYKEKRKDCKHGYLWRYRYYENGKQINIRRANLDDLEKEVKKRGQPWIKIEEI